MGWQRVSGYNWRALVEADISRWKRVIDDGLRSQTDRRQEGEVAVAADVSISGQNTCGRNPGVLRSAMVDIPPSDARLDRDLIVLLDHALAMVADHLAPEQRADLWQRTEKMGLGGQTERQCSPEVQRVLLSEHSRVNPDGGQVGEATSELHRSEEGVVVAEGSGKISGIPTS